MIQFIRKVLLLTPLLLASACTERSALAPVVDSNWRSSTNQSRYVVTRGDTLYSIAFRYDKDYQQLARLNHLSSPYTLRVGQVINLQLPSKHPQLRRPAYAHHPALQRQSVQQPVYIKPINGRWIWPATGHLVSGFVPQQAKKGIDIAGKRGDKIHAATSGVVAYAGNGLKGYGNLIIIKHNNQYLTAYGHNARNLVREGQTVKAGQVIADMGMVNNRYWGLHFEIRKSGKPVNPLNYLQRG